MNTGIFKFVGLVMVTVVGLISCSSTTSTPALERDASEEANAPIQNIAQNQDESLPVVSAATEAIVIPTSLPPSSPTALPTVTPTNTAVATATATPTATNTSTPTSTPTPLATNTPIPPPPIPIPELNLVPGQPQPYLSRFTLLSYYGTPQGPSLGILGAQPRYFTNFSLRNLRAEYQPYAGDQFIIPTYHIITTVADAWPGEDGNYNHWLDWGIIQDWLSAADEQNFAVIVDIQPGLADLDEEFDRVWGLLYNPHVHLAIDPEFTMNPGEVPGRELGQITAEQINAIQARMNGIGFEIGLNRVLIIHQFEDSMVLNKEQLQSFPFVELVIDADGFGNAGTKISDYVTYAGQPGFEYGGFKLFYDWDSPLMTPSDVMSLNPKPAVVIYQ